MARLWGCSLRIMQGIEAWGEYSLGTVKRLFRLRIECHVLVGGLALVMITIVSDNMVGCKAVFGVKTLVWKINH